MITATGDTVDDISIFLWIAIPKITEKLFLGEVYISKLQKSIVIKLIYSEPQKIMFGGYYPGDWTSVKVSVKS